MHKKRESLTVLATILFMVAASIANAQGGYWQQLNGPFGGNFQGMTVGPDSAVYLVTYQELFKRSPSGAGWSRVEVLPFSPDFSYESSIVPGSPRFISAFHRLFIVGDTLPSGSGPIPPFNEGIIISSDDGKTWSHTAMKIGVCNGIMTAEGALYALGFDANRSAIYKSSDSGSTWRIIFEDTITFNYITGCPMGNKLYLSTNVGIFTNTMGDSAWTRVLSIQNGNRGDQIFAVDSAICIVSETTVLGISHTPLFRTTNGGITWDSTTYLGTIGPITKDSSGILWVASSESGIVMSADSGKTWTDGHFSRYNAALSPTLCVTPTNILLLGTSQHIYQFSRNTGEWLPWDDSLKIENVTALLPINDDSILAWCRDAYYRTSDGGKTWTKDSIDGYIQHLNSPLIRDQSGYLYSNSLRYDPSVKRWSELVTGNQINPVVMAVDSSGYLYALSNTDVLRSQDHGDGWSSIVSNPYRWDFMTVDSRGRILAAVDRLILRSPDHGATWDTLLRRDDVYSHEDPGSICVTQSGRILVYCPGYDSMSNYFAMIQSTDDGASWQIAERSITPLSFALEGDSTVYMSCVQNRVNGSGVMKSSDAGGEFHWVSFSDDTLITFIVINPNHVLYAGTSEDGLFRYIPAASSVEKTAVSSPENFTIIPNPATSEIQITSTERNFSILDPLGRTYEVRQSGNTLDVSALPSGVYFVSDGHSRVKFVKE